MTELFNPFSIQIYSTQFLLINLVKIDLKSVVPYQKHSFAKVLINFAILKVLIYHKFLFITHSLRQDAISVKDHLTFTANFINLTYLHSNVNLLSSNLLFIFYLHKYY